MTLLSTPAAQAKTPQDRAPDLTAPVRFMMGASRCPSAHQGLSYYQLRHSSWLSLRGVKAKVNMRYPRSCAYTKFLAKRWKVKAYKARLAYFRWRESQWVLHDTPYGVRANAWLTSVREAQKVYPGTESWLLSCSAAEGGHGRWVGYGGQSYSTSLRDSDTVGGNMQFRWSTFRGMYRRSLDYVQAKGFIVPARLRDPDDDIAWRSALGQALAAGWARYTGNDNSHWSASWGNGC